MDVAKSRNCQSHTGALIASASLNPGEARVLLRGPAGGRVGLRTGVEGAR